MGTTLRTVGIIRQGACAFTRAGAVALALLALATGALGQEAQTADASPQGAVADYRLGPGDLISIRVQGVSEQHGLRVSNSGKIHVPHLGVMRVFDMTVPDLEAAIAAGLREKGLVRQPWVQVVIQQYRARPVYILGEVMMPGQFVIKDEMHIVDLVSLAGGLNEFATPVAYLYRRSALRPGEGSEAADGTTTAWRDEVIPVDFEKAASGADPEANVRLQGGDVLYVPERRKLHFYVVGEVLKPGAFEYPQRGAHPLGNALSEQSLLLTAAVAKAGGPLKTAKMSKGMLVRFSADGSRKEVPVDLAQVFRGRQPDILVEPNDIIYIPGSTAKSFAYSFLRVVPGMMVGALVYQ